MSDVLGNFIGKKKAESPFITLTDGESIQVKLRNIKMITKAGYGGEEKETLRLECDVDTSEGLRLKNFDNSTQRFAQELSDKGVKVGATFTITRTGMLTKTRYTISDVTGGIAPTTASLPTSATAPAAVATPAGATTPTAPAKTP